MSSLSNTLIVRLLPVTGSITVVVSLSPPCWTLNAFTNSVPLVKIPCSKASLTEIFRNPISFPSSSANPFPLPWIRLSLPEITMVSEVGVKGVTSLSAAKAEEDISEALPSRPAAQARIRRDVLVFFFPAANSPATTQSCNDSFQIILYDLFICYLSCFHAVFMK